MKITTREFRKNLARYLKLINGGSVICVNNVCFSKEEYKEEYIEKNNVCCICKKSAMVLYPYLNKKICDICKNNLK
jgi:hypothetical protein